MLTLIVAFALQAQPAPLNAGQISATLGEVRLARGGQLLPIQPNMQLLAQDQLISGPNGNASVLFGDGSLAYIGPSTTLALFLDNRARELQLIDGEVRVMASGLRDMTVLTKTTGVRVQNGAAWVAVGVNGARIWSEQGTASVRYFQSNKETDTQVAAGTELILPPAGDAVSRQATEQDWSINTRQLLLASGQQASQDITRAQAKSLWDRDRLGQIGGDAAARTTTANQGTSQSQYASALGTLGIGSSGLSAGSGTPASGSALASNVGDSFEYLKPDGTSVFLVIPAGLRTNEMKYTISGVNLALGDLSNRYWRIDSTPFLSSVAVPHTALFATDLGDLSNIDPAKGVRPNSVPLEIRDSLGEGSGSPLYNASRGTFRFTRTEVNQGTGAQEGQLEVATRATDVLNVLTLTPGATSNLPTIPPTVTNGDFVVVSPPVIAPQIRDLPLPTRAAFTVMTAESLFNYSSRTGQTRFVIDGKIIDITGYKRK